MERKQTLAAFLDSAVIAGATGVVVMWALDQPPFYSETGPVMSIFTAVSLLLLAGARLSRSFVFGFPTALHLAILVLVLGGNLSSWMMLSSFPKLLADSASPIVVTSSLTSVGLILFSLYELLCALRKTPQSAFILDDILLHLALVPGGLTILGHLLDNPAYLSMGVDPRVGISLLEMVFMATFASAAVFSNPNLFLWKFLGAGKTNRFVFAGLFVNQFIAPLIVAFLVPGSDPVQPGLELFVMLGGVLTTLAFLFIQAYAHYNPPETKP